ncbi:hypothetical protein OCJ37_17445 [Xanthomonas sp. AM6]|uniref:hypothetical protein n=1 Tax=Xanthomonas sp. AM6 TaxID=2982531 RepID=UPI0021DA3CE2|nr:hypothetical protein [Xanthomonas sp. AM6]UYB51731.1 hypothetical protein OCJ37_17445 [Xanthomonas sp. AM6]
MNTEHITEGTDDLQRAVSPGQRRMRVAAAYGITALILIAALYNLLCAFPATRVGDGAEYYVMERAVLLSHRPYADEAAWRAYEKLHATEQIADLLPAARLKKVYEQLTLGPGTDFNHFWFYPAAAAGAGWVASQIGMQAGSHAHFMLLHAVLIAGLLLLCFRLHGFKGALAALLIIALSPTLWFTNKVHTELFTIVFSTAAVAYALRRAWAWAGLALAIAATQNISFAIPALYACAAALVQMRDPNRGGIGAPVSAVVLSLAALVAALHPAYYFFRYGGLSPQLFLRGADTTALNPLSSIQYLLDPDIGLLPNWLLGALLVVAACFGLARRKDLLARGSLLAFFAVYIAAAMAAQAATVNINSGATPGPARYGLWYLCLFYPCFLIAARYLDFRGRRAWLAWLLGSLALFMGVTAVRDYWPTKKESYVTPSSAAVTVYTYAPWAWDPAIEVFAERNAQIGEMTPIRPAVVLGPGCRKLLYLPGRGANSIGVYPAINCGVGTHEAEHLLKRKLGSLPSKPTYLSLTQADLDSTLPALRTGQIVKPDQLSRYLKSGWSNQEPWGVWSLGSTSIVKFRVTETIRNRELVLTANGFWAGKRQSMMVNTRINGVAIQPQSFSATAPQPVRIVARLPEISAGSAVTVELQYDSTISPAAAGVSVDDRELAIGLTNLELRNVR